MVLKVALTLGILIFVKISGAIDSEINILDVILWKSVPKNYDLYFWTEKGKEAAIRNFILYKKRPASIKVFQNGDFQDIWDFGEHVDKRTRDSVSIILLNNSTRIPVEMIESLKIRRRSRRATIFILEDSEHVGRELSLLVNDVLIGRKNGTQNTAVNYENRQFSIESRIYIIFTPIDFDSIQRRQSILKVQVLEVYAVGNATKLSLVPGMTNVVNFTTLIGRPVRRKFDMESLAAVAEDNELTVHDAAFAKDSYVRRFSSGTYVSIYRDLQTMLNFSEVALVGSPIMYVGDHLSGMSYDLLESEDADLSIQIITMTPERAEWLSFLQPMSKGDGVWAFFLQPPLYSFRNIFLSPFQTPLWIALLCLYLGIIVSITVLSVLKAKHAESEDPPTNDVYFKEDGYFWAIGALCQKGWHRTPSSPSLRIVFFIGCAAGVIVYAGYSANIVSVLSVKVVPVSSFDQLLGFNFEFYTHEFSSIVQRILEGIIDMYHLNQKLRVTDTKDQVRRMRHSRAAFLSYPDIFYTSAYSLNETEKALCEEINALRIPISPGKGAMFIKKGSDLRSILNYRLMMIRERGLNARYWRKASERTIPRCLTETRAELQRLGISDVFTAILALAIGAGVALCFLCLELNLKQLARRLRRNSYKVDG